MSTEGNPTQISPVSSERNNNLNTPGKPGVVDHVKESGVVLDVSDEKNVVTGENSPQSEGDVGKTQEEVLGGTYESIYNEAEKVIATSDPHTIVDFLNKCDAEKLQILTVDHFNKVFRVFAETENKELYWVLYTAVSNSNNALASLWNISAEKEKQVLNENSMLRKLFWDTCSSDAPVSLNNTEVVNSAISIFANPAVSQEFKTIISHAVITNSSDYPGTCERSVEFFAERENLLSMPYAEAATYLDGLKYFNLLAYAEEDIDYNEDYDIGFQNKLPDLLKKKYENADLPYLIRMRLKKITDVSASDVHDDPYSEIDYDKYIMGSPEKEEVIHRDKKYPFHLSGTLYALYTDSNDLVVVDVKGNIKLQQAIDISESKRLSYEDLREAERVEDKAIFRFSEMYNIYPDTLYRALGEGEEISTELSEIIEKIRVSCAEEVTKSAKSEKIYLSKLFDFNQQYTDQSFHKYFSKQFDPESNKEAHILKKADLSKCSGSTEISDECWLDYRFIASSSVFEVLLGEFGVDVTCLSLREQVYFLDYLKNKKESEVGKFKAFCNTYGIKGARTFLSLERGGGDLGDKIVALGERGEVAEKVFTYFGELLDAADRAEELVKSISHCALDECRDVTEKIRENLLNRAQKDLEKAIATDDTAQVEDLVKNYVVQAKEYVALVQEVGAGNIENKKPSELEESEKEEMVALLEENYEETYPGEENADFRKMVQESFENSFKNPNTVFRLLRDKGKIISFNRFDTLTDHEGREVTYFGSFNVAPAYSGVGGVMLDRVINERIQDGRLMMAHCGPTQPITKKYIESGFIASQFFIAESKVNGFEILRTKDMLSRFKTKTMTKEELLANIDEADKPFRIREQGEQDTYPELQEGNVLTRYFTHGGKTYVVFENAPPNFKDSLTIQESHRL